MRPRVRSAALTGYADLARSLGLDPAAALVSEGLDVSDLDVPDRWLPGAAVARVLERSARDADCPDLGLRLAELRRLGALGPISVVLRDEPDLGSALDLLIRYERVYNEALHVRLASLDGLATLTLWLEFGEPAPTDQALDLTMAAVLGVIRALVGGGWTPLSASFARPQPADPGAYHRVFGPGVRFGQDATCLVFRSQDLAAPVVISDPSLRPYSQRFLHTVVAPGARTAVDQVAETVEMLLPLGRCSVQQVSRHLGLRPRVLQQRLAEEGESYSSVVHATRAGLVERYLSSDRYSLTEVSGLLGFRAPSAFTRWFRGRFGTSPSDWRRAARTAAGTAPPPGTARPVPTPLPAPRTAPRRTVRGG
ncbi:AraC family transcriptional regulator [Geodermatophilus sp. SYSU D00965]